MELAFGPGTVLLGKYRVESVLGRGGMGMVLRVTHLHLGEELAIKVLLPGGAASQDMAARFLREAQAAARLRGEHITRVVDVGLLPDGQPYMVMEYLHGIDLSRRLKERGALQIGEAVDYALQACEALAEAHARGIVHRDIKPANLFLTSRPDGSPMVKVLDFGISKAPIASHALTRTDTVMGTAGYMSPEQMKASKDVDARTDIWALGTVLYECLCGRPPFVGESFAAVVLMAGTDPPPPMDPRIPRGLQTAVLRCLEKDRKARFPSIAALATALAPFARDQRAAPVIVDRTNSMLPRTAPTRDVTPVPIREEPTTVHQHGQITAPPTRSSARRWFILGGSVLVSVFVAAGIVGAPHGSDARSAASSASRGSSVVGEPVVQRPAVVEASQPDPVDADPPAIDANDVARNQQQCMELQAAKKWHDLLACGKMLNELGSSMGEAFQARAQAEAKNERLARDVERLIGQGKLRESELAVKSFSSDSGYFSAVSESFEKANTANIKEATKRANGLLIARNCDGLRRMMMQESTGNAGTQGTIAAIQAAMSKCVTERPIVATSVSGLSSVADCDHVDEWVIEAQAQYIRGDAQVALSWISKALACKSDVRLYRFATVYSCAAHDPVAAKLYFAKVPENFQPGIEQKCQLDHVDLRGPQ